MALVRNKYKDLTSEDWKKMGTIVAAMYLGVPAFIAFADAIGYIDQPLTLSFLAFMSVFLLIFLFPMFLIFFFVDVDALVGID